MHFSCFPSLEDMAPKVDRAFAALVTDLHERNLLDTTLVVMMGEMGRTPRINNQAGRDHWSQAQSVLIAGGGVRPGRVIGATDKHATAPISDPVGVDDLLFTVFHLMGIDTTKTYYTPLGRPVPILGGGKMIAGLV
jgi:membrane-anchored protein YejM (alkaline phosphatase superfamily)